MKTADEQQAEDDAAMTDDELMAELVETTSFVGKVRPWRETPETDDDPDDALPAGALREEDPGVDLADGVRKGRLGAAPQ